MKFAIVVFPGTSGERELYHTVKDLLDCEAEYIWHKETNLDAYDAVLLPGGLAHGDYLRCGALAARTAIIPAIKEAALAGKPVLGICNGFQILTEAGLLPGAFLQNEILRFMCGMASVVVENNETMFTKEYTKGETIELPIAHGQGRYWADEATIRELKATNRIVFTYKDNPNGSTEHIAGIVNETGNVLGLMPHPERAVEKLLGSDDGKRLFQSILETWRMGL